MRGVTFAKAIAGRSAQKFARSLPIVCGMRAECIIGIMLSQSRILLNVLLLCWLVPAVPAQAELEQLINALQAKYDRKVREQVLALLEQQGPQRVAEDPGDWTLVGSGAKSTFDEGERVDLRSQARELVQTNPYARNILRLLEVYVAGPGLKAVMAPLQPDTAADLLQLADRLWADFLAQNHRRHTRQGGSRKPSLGGQPLQPQPAGRLRTGQHDFERAVAGWRDLHSDAGARRGSRPPQRDVHGGVFPRSQTGSR
mgnify:CR=1 FL=1